MRVTGHLKPRRIVLVLPCCIGDVLMATATLAALRRAWPDAHIAWAVGGAARAVISDHDMLNATLECDPLPQRSPRQLLRLARQLREGGYDLAISLTRSPLLSLALRMSGIPLRAGLDSGGRGLGYNLRVPLDPALVRHEAEIYLDVARALGLDVSDCQANVPVRAALWPALRQRLLAAGVDPQRYALLLPAGGSNPGTTMAQKRWPPQHYAQLARQLGIDIVLVGGPEDSVILAAVGQQLSGSYLSLAGELSFAEIALLACRARVAVGNDSGLTHLAAAAGARTVAIFGPSDPRRYAPFAAGVLVLWRPGPLPTAGVSAGAVPGWSWQQHGIGADEVCARVLDFLEKGATSASP